MSDTGDYTWPGGNHWTTPLDCGHLPTPPTTFHTTGIPFTTGAATDRETGEAMCYGCADSRQAGRMASADRVTAYLSSDGRNVTTWSGGVLARVTSETTSHAGFHGSELTYVRAEDADGRAWYGRNGGRGMAINLRRSRSAA